MDTKPVRASVQTYRNNPEIRCEVSVKNLPDQPTRMELDSRCERSLLTGLVFLLLVGTVVWEILSLVTTHGPGNLT
jgi:hypothetical protein